MRQVHLVGQFPALGAAEVVRLCALRLAGVISHFPCDGEPGSGPFEAAAAALADLKAEGAAPADAIVQTSIVLAASAIWSGASSDMRPVDAPRNGRSQQIVVPLADLAEGAVAHPDRKLVAQTVTALQQVMAAIPAAVPAAVHFSCRDGARYVMSPTDLAHMVGIANGLTEVGLRAGDRLHFPVPLRHDDDAFFRPLADLAVPARDMAFLGLVHLSDGEDGALRRAEMASTHLSHFGIGPRSGFAARTPDDIPRFLSLHRAVALQLDPH